MKSRQEQRDKERVRSERERERGGGERERSGRPLKLDPKNHKERMRHSHPGRQSSSCSAF